MHVVPRVAALQHNYGRRGPYDLRIVWDSDVVVVEVPKLRTRVSADLREDADKLDALAHALADYLGRTVVVVATDDKETVVTPRTGRTLDS